MISFNPEQIARAKTWAMQRAQFLCGDPKETLFVLDSENTEAFDKLLAYALGEDNTDFPTRKGLIIRGTIGTGKTLFFDIFQGVAVKMGKSPVSAISCKKLVKEYIHRGYDGIDAIIGTHSEFLFDDLGDEQPESKYMGNPLCVMDYVITSRYELFTDKGIRSHFTSNMVSDEMVEKYGERAISRIRQMCNDVKMEGKDRRK